MKIPQRANQVLELIKAQRAELRDIVARADRDDDFTSADERLARWKERTVRLIAENIGPREASKLAEREKRSYIVGEDFRNLADEAQMYEGFLQALADELESHPEDLLRAASAGRPAASPVSVAKPIASRAVFLIHGHDELNLLRLKEIIRDRWQLESVVLSGQSGKGRTIIEKFEDEAQQAVFALALLTPDDVVASKGGEYGQPRPNTVFELGWFYGRLGRARVCLLLKQGTKLHSDLDGISRVEFRVRCRKAQRDRA
jgi:predicted nucleotide-binding protein